MSPHPIFAQLSRPRRMRAVVLLTAAMAAVLLCTPAQAEQTPHDRALRQLLEELVRTPGGPPGAIVVLLHGHQTKIYRAGVADLDTGLRPRPDDHMRIASVAKAFSGAVALSLVDRKKLSLDDTIGERLPQLPAAWRDVTLRQLLNHTSGLPDYLESPRFIEEFTADPRRLFDSRRLLDYVAEQPLRFPPGSQYRYSNSDNTAVALMAEAVSGRSYENLLKSLVFNPLHLRSTSLPQDYRLPRPFLHGYAVEPPNPPEDVEYGVRRVRPLGVGRDRVHTERPHRLHPRLRGREAHLAQNPRTAAALRRRQLRTRGPWTQRSGPGHLPLHHQVRGRVRPHRQLLRLHPTGRRDARRPPLTDILYHHTGEHKQAGDFGEAPEHPGGVRVRSAMPIARHSRAHRRTDFQPRSPDRTGCPANSLELCRIPASGSSSRSPPCSRKIVLGLIWSSQRNSKRASDTRAGAGNLKKRIFTHRCVPLTFPTGLNFPPKIAVRKPQEDPQFGKGQQFAHHRGHFSEVRLDTMIAFIVSSVIGAMEASCRRLSARSIRLTSTSSSRLRPRIRNRRRAVAERQGPKLLQTVQILKVGSKALKIAILEEGTQAEFDASSVAQRIIPHSVLA